MEPPPFAVTIGKLEFVPGEHHHLGGAQRNVVDAAEESHQVAAAGPCLATASSRAWAWRGLTARRRSIEAAVLGGFHPDRQ